ncbi:unnamed protein product [marine sediment metagenome]|uniref:Uncharacterized protein n=1 Tax=marine sediment metagenome TaxID=412755 RepID=X1J7P2_9ZZZZ
MDVIERGTIVIEGGDRQDYSSAIDEIKRGETFVQFAPRADERQKVFYIAYFPGAPLGVGETAKFLDRETNLEMPYTSPIGFLASQRERFFSFNGAIRFTLVVDTLDPIVLFPSADNLMGSYEAIAAIDTKYWDPDAKEAHTWEMSITNVDTIPISGTAQVALVLTEISSAIMTEKKVRCRKCRNVMTVPLTQTKVKCTKCGYEFTVPFFGGNIV